MTCELLAFPDGSHGWMCGSDVEDDPPSCSVCGAPGAEYLCDGPAERPQRDHATCDAPLCGKCTAQTDPLITVPTYSFNRCAMRFAGGNVTGPGDRLTAPEQKEWRELAAFLFEREPHDYCPRCSALLEATAAAAIPPSTP